MECSNAAARTFVLSLPLLLLVPTLALGIPAEGTQGPRVSSMVHFDIFSTRLYSDSVSGWENFMVGRVNRTTIIETTLVNDLEAPLADVEVTCTSYWYEGNYPDRGHIIFREMVLVDLPSGKGSLSPRITFRWTPTISGSYIINVSAHVPGDARPMSTDPIFFQGRKYEQENRGHFYSGVWISRNYWDCSSMDGWETLAEDGDPEHGWRPVKHPLSVTPDLQHSAPWSFWAGSEDNWTAPLNGTYSLIGPELNLEGFSADPYDIEIGARRPQIHLIYRYRGNLTPGEDGKGRIQHRISTDGGTTWRPLNDSRGMQVVISGSTPTGYWSFASRPPAIGSNPLIGIDLGSYIGKKVRLRFDLVPSGLNETGILLDDFALMGIDRLEERPFSLGPPSNNGFEIEPSGRVSYTFTVTSAKWRSDLVLRFVAVNSSPYLSLERDIVVEPEVLHIPSGSMVQTTVHVNATIPKGAISGPGKVLVRAAGGGHTQDIELTFDVRPVHRLTSRIDGNLNGPIEPEVPVPMTVHVENTGNIRENVELAFVTASDLRWDQPRWTVVLEPGRGSDLSGNLSLDHGSLSGPKDGSFVISPISLPSDREVLSRIDSGEPEADWTVFPVSYVSRQFHDVRLISTATSQYIDDPPEEGASELLYNMFLVNRGNGDDVISFQCYDTGAREGIELVLPKNITMGANDTRVVDIRVRVVFPLPDGIYNFTIAACSSGDEDMADNIVELFLIVGRPPVSRGIFLINGSLQVRPENVIKGQEAIFFFKARSFGYLQPVQFTVNLLLDGVQFDTGVFTSSISGIREYQFTVRFQDHGTRNVSLVLAGAAQTPVPGGDLRRTMNLTIQVRFIEISIEDIGLDGLFGEGLNRTFSPEEHDIRAMVRNLGDITADLVTLHITVQEVSEPKNRTVLVINLSDLGPGTSVTISQRFRSFSPGTTYQITAAFQDRGTWKDSNTTNDLRSMVIVIGEREPPVPFWRRSLFLYISAGTLIVGLTAVAYLLIRKKL